MLRRLAKRPMTAKEIAEAATMDAPATTVAVNDLEDRGLVVREIDPTNRRCKLVSLTDEGRRVVASIDEVDDPAPGPFAALSQAELPNAAGNSRQTRDPLNSHAVRVVHSPGFIHRAQSGGWRPVGPGRQNQTHVRGTGSGR